MKLLLILLLFIPLTCDAQFSAPIVIDSTSASMGIKKIIVADLNNDNLNEVIVTQSFNVDKIGFYLNSGNGSFSSKTVIDGIIDDPISVASGNLNNDNQTDLVVMTQTNGEIFIYLNNGDLTFTKQEIDSGIVFGNAVGIGDFNEDGHPDLAAIGQHSIDLYENDGTGSFTKTPILTTQTSPNILECMYMEFADMNNDDHLDILTAETIGAVIYYNDGNANFDPVIITSEQFTTKLVHALDVNDDNNLDVVLQHSNGDVKLYLNNGNETFTLTSTLFNSTPINSLLSTDINADDYPELYAAYSNKVRIRHNDGSNGFGSEQFIYQSSTRFVNEVALGDLSGNNAVELIWSAVGGTLAYHENQLLNTTELSSEELILSPNPAKNVIRLENASFPLEITISDLYGNVVFRQQLSTESEEADVSILSAGTYILSAVGSGQQSIFIKL